MRLNTLACALALLMAAALTACQPEQTIIVMVVTATPTTESQPTTQPATSGGQAAPSATPAPVFTQSPVPTASAPSAFPTPTVREIYVAEQVFQQGRMFWLEPTRQIWVLLETSPGVGVWQVYDDRFAEGMAEFDPSIVAPEGLYQPVRGFGLIWRGNPEVRDTLGWATDGEFGYIANYEYQPAGDLTETGYVAGPGFHFLRSQYGEWFRFNEVNGTWQAVNRTTP
ncbi:MAG: hypothetical protein MUC99_01735, partial [Anaerolineae bacterium]|nr:hypothetical protein [Anaerolineae bacterium]